ALRDKDRVWSALPRDRRKGGRAGGGALARRAVPGVARAVLTPEADATIDNRTFVLILQHPQEKREPLATAPAILGTLRNAKLVAGLSWPNLTRPLGHDADPRRWAVLYLGSTRPAALAHHREILLLGRDGQPVAEPDPVLKHLDGIVLLDGTWSQAKTLWWRNPWLLKLHRLVLNPLRPARLGRLRREPRREALSTLESASLVLRHDDERDQDNLHRRSAGRYARHSGGDPAASRRAHQGVADPHHDSRGPPRRARDADTARSMRSLTMRGSWLSPRRPAQVVRLW